MLLTILKRVCLRTLGSSDAALLRRYVPRPYAWLTGGR